MKKTSKMQLILAAMMALSLLGATACKKKPAHHEGPMESAGSSVDSAAHDTADATEEAAEDTGDKIEEATDSK